MVKKFEDLEIWQRARAFALKIHTLTESGAFGRDYGLIRQINDSSGSIMDNIAEGFERNGNREFVQFLSTAKGSAAESKSQLYRAQDKNYITTENCVELVEEATILGRKIGSFITYLNDSPIKGPKFNRD